MDSQVSAYKIWGNTYGEKYAIGQLRAFNRAMDNLNVTERIQHEKVFVASDDVMRLCFNSVWKGFPRQAVAEKRMFV